MKLPSHEAIGQLVYGFMRALHRYDAGRTLPVLHSANVTTAQLAVLDFTREAQKMSGIAAYLGLSRPATSQLVEKLVRAGLVGRTEGAEDRRERNVVLTLKGRKLVDRIAAARAARFNSALAVLPHDLAAEFQTVLQKVVKALDDAPD